MDIVLAATDLGLAPHVVLVCYLLILLGLGIVGYLRGKATEEDYYLAGRNQGLLVTSLTIMATFFSGVALLGFPGLVYEHGVSAMFLALNLPVAGAAVFPQYFLSRLASENVKVVLGGQGGDELFCGYARYLVGYLESCLQRAIYGTAPMAGSVRLEDIAPNLDYLGGYEPMMQHFFADGLFTDPADRYYRLLLSTRRSQEMDDILRPDLKPPGYATHEVFRDSFMAPETDDLIDRMTYMDIKDHLQSLLHLEDRTSMAVSLESRLPLLDHRVVEQVFAVPAHERFAAGKPKFLLRQAIADWVPEPIMQRSDKMGFPVPIFEWFQGSMRPFVEDILLGQQTVQRGVFNAKAVERCLRAEKPFGRTVWGLLSLELWFRNFFD